MDILNINNVKIDGVVSCLPENLIDNKAECSTLFGNGVDTLIKATGIYSRALANKGTTALDLEVKAASELLKMTNTKPDDIGAVICVTFTPEFLMPSDAPSAQHRLGLPNHIMAFDISLACSGYGYGLYIASTLVNALNKKVLLLNGDVQSAYVSKSDKATFPILADIGTATLISPSDSNNIWKFAFYSDGSKRDALLIPSGGSKNPISINDLNYIEYEDGSKRRETHIYMNGFEVFKFVAQDVSKYINEFINNINSSVDLIDVFVPHQANIYMINQLAKKLKFKTDQLWISGDIYGNPASASIPLTISKNASKYFENRKEANVLLSGFGGGLSISVGNIQLNQEGIYTIINYKENN